MFTKRPQAVVPLVALRLPCVFYIFPLNLLPQKICASSPIILVCVSIFKLCKLVFLYLLGRLMMRVVVHLYAVWWCSLLRGGRPPPAAHSAQPRPLFQLLPAATNTDMMHCHALDCAAHCFQYTNLFSHHSWRLIHPNNTLRPRFFSVRCSLRGVSGPRLWGPLSVWSGCPGVWLLDYKPGPNGPYYSINIMKEHVLTPLFYCVQCAPVQCSAMHDRNWVHRQPAVFTLGALCLCLLALLYPPRKTQKLKYTN